MDEAQAVCGSRDEHLTLLAGNLPVTINYKNQYIYLDGEEESINKCIAIIESLRSMHKNGECLNAEKIHQLLDSGSSGFQVMKNNRVIYPRTDGQKKYFQALQKNEIVFCSGPAGSGKTWLAAACAVSLLQQNRIDKIILSRPIVEAGESLGFLPGSVESKISPYLRPLFDALSDMIDKTALNKYCENGIIEVAPLAYMRGRNLNHSFVILDEAQNTTAEQMKMFLTRLGRNSRMAVCGDITQVDRPFIKNNGMLHAVNSLKQIAGIGFCSLSVSDIIRHSLVQKVVLAWEAAEQVRS